MGHFMTKMLRLAVVYATPAKLSHYLLGSFLASHVEHGGQNYPLGII